MPSNLMTRRRWLAQSASAAMLSSTALRESGKLMAGQKAELRVIDSHVHVWKNDPRYPWPSELRTPPAVDALPDTLLELMQRNGVGRTVVVHVIYYRWDCRYTADSVAAHRDKLSGVCRVDPQGPQATSDLQRWVNAGFHGVRLSPAAGPEGDWINDRALMDPIWNQASELAIPMCVLCPIVRIPDVERVIERYDGRLDVCIDHMADCPIDQPNELKKLLALARFPRVFVKLSHLWSLSREEYPYRDTYDQVKRLYDAFGPQRLMWGTDWPAIDAFCGYGRALELYRDEIKFFNDDDRRWILGKTALRLWPATA